MNALEELCNAIDRIEAEYMELPRDADGVPCKIGDHVKSGETCGDIKEMLLFERGGVRWEIYLTTLDDSVSADSLRHVRPEPPDSQERIDEDAGKMPCKYFGYQSKPCESGEGCPAALHQYTIGCFAFQRLELLARQRKLDGVSE